MTNLIILFCALIVFLILEFTVNRGEFFSVGFIATAVFALSTGYAIICFAYFAADITLKTVCVVLGALAVIFVGECFANLVTQKTDSNGSLAKSANAEKTFEPIVIKHSYVYFLTFLCLTLGAVRYYLLYRVSLSFGNPHNILKAIAYTRSALVAGELEGHRLLSYGCVFCMAAVYTALFIYFHNLLICKQNNLKLLFPVLAYLLIPLSSTGRVEYIQYLVVIFTIFVICFRRSKNWRKNGNIKILLTAVAVFVIFIFIFRFIGSLRDKWSMPSDVMKNLAEYLSAGIYGLDSFLDVGPDYSLSFGYESLAWLYAIVNRFFGTDISAISFQPFFTVGDITSNTYTGLKPFIQDFSILGMLCIGFLLGFINTFWLNFIKAADDLRKRFMWIVAFSIYIYPTAMLSVANTFNALLTTGYLLFFIMLAILNRFIINPDRSLPDAKENKNGKIKNGGGNIATKSDKDNSGTR